MPVKHVEQLIEERSDALRRFHARCGVPRAELDLSGGIDSAVMLGLLTRALGPESVTTVHSRIHTSDAATERARLVAEQLGVRLIEIDLSELFDDLVSRMRDAMQEAGSAANEIEARIERDPTILGSIRSTLRAPVGRGFNRLAGGGIRHGTGNECEDRWLRFFQKGGDGEVDTNPLAMLSKGEVYQLAVGLSVPRSLIEATPSPDLWGVGNAHADELELAELLGLDSTWPGCYSSVDPDSGEYRNFGIIERVSRFLDQEGVEDLLFADSASPTKLADLHERAALDPVFAGLPTAGLPNLLQAVRRIERATRHKANPACTSLGNRSELITKQVLSNTLSLTERSTP